MEELKQLEQLSLVSKICTELDNHLGINDKDLGKVDNRSFHQRSGRQRLESFLPRLHVSFATSKSPLTNLKSPFANVFKLHTAAVVQTLANWLMDAGEQKRCWRKDSLRKTTVNRQDELKGVNWVEASSEKFVVFYIFDNVWMHVHGSDLAYLQDS